MAFSHEAQLVAELAARIQAGLDATEYGIKNHYDGEKAYRLAKTFYDKARNDYPAAVAAVTAKSAVRQPNPLNP